MSEKMKLWQNCKNAVSAAKSWQALPSGPYYQNDTFAISLAHCKAPQLVRAGQQSCGGRNYWETEEAFNKAILEYIVGNWQAVYPEVLKIMEEKERKALIACQDYVKGLQELIDQAEALENNL